MGCSVQSNLDFLTNCAVLSGAAGRVVFILEARAAASPYRFGQACVDSPFLQTLQESTGSPTINHSTNSGSIASKQSRCEKVTSHGLGSHALPCDRVLFSTLNCSSNNTKLDKNSVLLIESPIISPTRYNETPKSIFLLQVVQLLCQCTCPTQFPMVRIGDGKYKVGDKLIIFVRILRRHIMVRVGGGWQELSEFLRQKDPCRTKSPCQGYLNHSATPSGLKIATPSPPHTPTPPSLATPPRTMVTSIPVSRSRLLGSGHHLNKGYRNHKLSPKGGRRSISGSASMSWLSHNS